MTRKNSFFDSEIASILGQSDLRFGNLETTFAKDGIQADKLVVLKAEPGAEMRLQKLGFNILNMANNHILDYGYDGLFDTIAVLDDLGVKRTGVGKNINEALKPATAKINNTTLAFLGFTSSLPAGYAAGPDKPGVAPIRVRTKYYIDPNQELEEPGVLPAIFTEPVEEDLDRILLVVRKLETEADGVCVSAHWGVAFQDEVMDYQKIVAHALIDAGADAIIGHHPHVLHGIE
ncbi:MAG: CapA family protein, partial [Desulfobacteraceae bacterium]|nr:CapA family protein [Desulfobacteraceae bacterium]